MSHLCAISLVSTRSGLCPVHWPGLQCLAGCCHSVNTYCRRKGPCCGPAHTAHRGSHLSSLCWGRVFLQTADHHPRNTQQGSGWKTAERRGETEAKEKQGVAEGKGRWLPQSGYTCPGSLSVPPSGAPEEERLREPWFFSIRSQGMDNLNPIPRTRCQLKKEFLSPLEVALTMAGTWLSDVSERDTSLAVCQHKLYYTDDEAAGGKEAAVRIHLILKAHTWQATLPPPPSHLNAWHAARRCLAGDSKVFIFPSTLCGTTKRWQRPFYDAMLMLCSARGHGRHQREP